MKIIFTVIYLLYCSLRLQSWVLVLLFMKLYLRTERRAQYHLLFPTSNHLGFG